VSWGKTRGNGLGRVDGKTYGTCLYIVPPECFTVEVESDNSTRKDELVSLFFKSKDNSWWVFMGL
jgi:hypothetical protein